MQSIFFKDTNMNIGLSSIDKQESIQNASKGGMTDLDFNFMSSLRVRLFQELKEWFNFSEEFTSDISFFLFIHHCSYTWNLFFFLPQTSWSIKSNNQQNYLPFFD